MKYTTFFLRRDLLDTYIFKYLYSRNNFTLNFISTGLSAEINFV